MSQMIQPSQFSIYELRLLELVEEKARRSLNAREKRQLIDLIPHMSKATISKLPRDKIIPHIVNILCESLHDLREYQQAIIDTPGDNSVYGIPTDAPAEETSGINITQVLGATTLESLRGLIQPSATWRHCYVACDTDSRDTTEDTTVVRSFRWTYIPNGIAAAGTCTSSSDCHNIIGMRLYQPRIPYVASMANTTKRVSVRIREFANYSYAAAGRFAFHFLLRPNYIAGQTQIELSTEDYNDGLFMFRDPIQSLTTLTFEFGDPFDIISFPLGFPRFFLAVEFLCLPV